MSLVLFRQLPFLYVTNLRYENVVENLILKLIHVLPLDVAEFHLFFQDVH